MAYRITIVYLPILLWFLLPYLPEATAASYASCRRACKNVGVQLKASAKPVQSQSKLFQAEVNTKLQSMSQSWDFKTKAMQVARDAQISEILNAIQELKTEIKNTREALCPLSFNGRCYWAVFEKNMNYTMAEKACARIPNGKPSNIYGHDHLFVVLKYLRTLVRRNQITVYAWLGMTVDPESEKVSFTTGQTPKTVKWRPNQPDFAIGYTQLMIMARTDANRRQEGLYNQNPAYEKPAVLCEA